MELEADYNRERGHCNGEERGYSVEARYNYTHPVQLGGQLFDNRWRQVEFKESAIGVPPHGCFSRKLKECGLLGYAAAQALRWWLHAAADAAHGGMCLETRIISHKITYSHKIEVVGAHGHIHGEDRSNCIPDWGKDVKP